MHYSDEEIANRLNQSNQKVLKYLFDVYYHDLVCYVMKFVAVKEIAEEIVQDTFIRIWKNRKLFKLTGSIESYLFTSVKNRSINYLKSKSARIRFVDLDHSRHVTNDHTIEDDLKTDELKKEIHRAIQSLPSKCRIIFNLSRNAGLSNEEIANHLNISKKTVQTQIGIAIQKIRKHLANRWDNIPS